MRSLIIVSLLSLVLAGQAQLFFPPAISFINSPLVTVSAIVSGQTFTGTGTLAYLTTANPTVNPYQVYATIDVLGETGAGWTNYGLTGGKWILDAVASDPQTGCMEVVTGYGGANGSITCTSWKQVSTIPAQQGKVAATKFTQQCTVTEEDVDAIITNAVVVSGSTLVQSSMSTAVAGQSASVVLQVATSLPAPPPASAFTPCTATAQGSKRGLSLTHVFLSLVKKARTATIDG